MTRGATVQLDPFASLHPTVALNVCCCVSSRVEAVGNSVTVTATGLIMIVPLVANELMGLLALVTVRVTGSAEGMTRGETVPWMTVLVNPDREKVTKGSLT